METDKLHLRVKQFFDGNAGSYDQVVLWTTLGQDVLWKRRLLSLAECPGTQPRYILDMACGTGIVTMKLARKYPEATIVGIDLTQAYLELATKKAASAGISDRITYYELAAEHADQLDRTDFDLIVSSYLPKYMGLTDLARLTDDILSLTPGSTAVFHDFAQPHGLFRLGYDVYWLGLKPVLRLVGWQTVSQELKELIKATDRWPEELAASLVDNHLAHTQVFNCLGRYAAIVQARR